MADLSFVPVGTQNFLVPADGGTHIVKQSLNAGAVAQMANWVNFKADVGWKFTPQGAYVDNRAGGAALVFTSQQTGFSFSVAAGLFAAVHFPSAADDVWSITGNGAVVIYWADYPILPEVLAGGNVVTIGNTPLPVSVPASAGGVPYAVQENPRPSVFQYMAGAAAATAAAALAPGANLRRLRFSLSGNASIAAAGLNVFVVNLNGVAVYQESVSLPAAPPAAPAPLAYAADIDFNFQSPVSGGNLQVTSTNALTTGTYQVLAYYD